MFFDPRVDVTPVLSAGEGVMSNSEYPPPTPPGDSKPEDRYQPQFGQRSTQWSAGSQPGQPKSQDGDDRPWPVYDPAYNQGPSRRQQTKPQGYAPYGQWGAGQVPDAGFSGANPNVGGPQGYQPDFPVRAPNTGPLPSRTWPIITLVSGVILAIIVAPVVLVTMIVGGVNLESFIDGSVEATSGDRVVVGESGMVAIIAQDSSSLGPCVLTAGAETIALEEAPGSGATMGTDVPPGTYQLDCPAAAGKPLYVFVGQDLTNLMDSTMKGFGWATFVGLSGLVVFVVGIVWLVKRNRQRREISNPFGAGPYGPGNYHH